VGAECVALSLSTPCVVHTQSTARLRYGMLTHLSLRASQPRGVPQPVTLLLLV
jgi:hypothetical protein